MQGRSEAVSLRKGWPSARTDITFNATKQRSDAAGRTLRSLDQLDNATVFTYDASGNQLSVRDPNNVGADMVYDQLGRDTSRTDTQGDVTSTIYDRSGNAIRQTDAKTKFTTIAFDARGRRKSTTDRISAVTSFTYRPGGQLLSLTDAENQTTSYTYDARGAKLTEQYPDHTGGTSPGNLGYGIVTFVYDNAGRVLRKQDQQGDTVTFNYDLAGRMSSRDFRLRVNSPSGTIADSDVFTYARAGRMLTAYTGRYGNTVTQVYDSVGRKESEALQIAAQTYTVGINYNARGELIKYTYPDGSIVDRTYHATGNLHQVKLAGTTLDTRTYDTGGRQTTSTDQNFRSICDHDLEERKDFELVFPLAPVLRGEGSGVRGKLIEVLTGVNATVNGYGFNAVDTTYNFEDRLTQWKRANGTATSRTHGPTHELTAIGASSLAYYAKGNLTQDTSRSPTQNYVWDYDNKMRSADIDGNGSADVSFEYDALGRRVARTQGANAVVYFQVDQQTICDYPRGGAAASPTYRYFWGSYIDELIARKATGTGGAVLFAHRNQQYSIYAYSNSSGSVVERIAYAAYGQPTFMNAAGTVQSTSPNSIRYSYTGRQWDASLQLHHFRARWMGPVTGRFLGREPIGYAGSEWNLVELLCASPLRFHDPSGAIAILPAIPAAAVAAAAAVLSCMATALVEGRMYYPKDEQMRHCWASCVGAKRCSVQISILAGFTFEVVDVAMTYARGLNPLWDNHVVDLINNQKGNLCAGLRGMPIIGSIGQCAGTDFVFWMFGYGCADCCKRSR